ncbi:UNVERIFIED_CONTAM: hypothetical protein FKN15_031758 [Acipenser sinensis]
MKRPLSPAPLGDNGLSGAGSDLGGVTEPHPASSEQRAKREKKHQTYTLCEVCNIQLNSLAQAQIHYNGKSHQKRLKQINKGKPASSQVNLQDPEVKWPVLQNQKRLKQINKGKPASSQGSAHRYHPCADTGVAKKKTRCPPKRVPSADRFFTLCRLTVQPPQSYSVGGQRSSGQLTGKPAGARPQGSLVRSEQRTPWFTHRYEFARP